MISPAVVHRCVVIGGMIAVVAAVAAVRVRAVNAGIGDVIDYHRPRHVGASPASDIGALNVTGIPSCGDDACAIVVADDSAGPVDAVVNLHSITIDGADLPVRTDYRR